MSSRLAALASSLMPNRQDTQAAALPFRHTAEGQVEVLLITSRRARRWIIPKGWPVPGWALHDSAAREAFEEAGVTGSIGSVPLGSVEHLKRPRVGPALRCCVKVFPLHVEEVRAWWQENRERDRRWCSRQEAVDLIAH